MKKHVFWKFCVFEEIEKTLKNEKMKVAFKKKVDVIIFITLLILKKNDCLIYF